uniref:Uncharacterized protein n=1 Tax=Anguilla anguilla TaxID=7936 RepID=A0A0E9PTH8_ANGAN
MNSYCRRGEMAVLMFILFYFDLREK